MGNMSKSDLISQLRNHGVEIVNEKYARKSDIKSCLKKIAADRLDVLERRAESFNQKLDSICGALKKAGIKYLEVQKGDIDVDAMIQLEGGYHIQVGHNYLVFSKEEGEGDDWGIREIATARDIQGLIPKIKNEIRK